MVIPIYSPGSGGDAVWETRVPWREPLLETVPCEGAQGVRFKEWWWCALGDPIPMPILLPKKDSVPAQGAGRGGAVQRWGRGFPNVPGTWCLFPWSLHSSLSGQMWKKQQMLSFSISVHYLKTVRLDGVMQLRKWRRPTIAGWSEKTLVELRPQWWEEANEARIFRQLFKEMAAQYKRPWGRGMLGFFEEKNEPC